jgi:hypothetical protein
MRPAEGLQKQIELYRQMTGRQRLQIGFELYELAHEMVQCSVRQQHPDWDARQVSAEVLRRFRLAERLR